MIDTRFYSPWVFDARISGQADAAVISCNSDVKHKQGVQLTQYRIYVHTNWHKACQTVKNASIFS